ncbi:MAG TPA: hypothetical protein VM118_00085, partial [Acidobacteriota bacterium]|nr:hypothetical protein [Acidobacteriota bacterium]
MHGKKRILRVELAGGRYVCHIIRKKAGDREHKFYWRKVKCHPEFERDPFFTKNEEGQARSDSSHRARANYSDHVNRFPKFRALDEAYLRERVQRIASIEVSDAPIPRTDSFPDTENVQLVAYHRMVRYRNYLDEILGTSNSFWKVHRNPSWCPDFLDFQIIDPEYANRY